MRTRKTNTEPGLSPDEITPDTNLLQNHRLTLDFPAGSVRIERSADN